MKTESCSGTIYKEHRALIKRIKFILGAGQSQTEGLSFTRVSMLPYDMAKASHVKRTSKQEGKGA